VPEELVAVEEAKEALEATDAEVLAEIRAIRGRLESLETSMLRRGRSSG
jgi:predicted  nucleic acid-binding Zn-ribbon protein